RVGQTQSGHEVVLRRLVQAARLTIDAGKREAAANVELAHRYFRRWVGRILGAGGRLDRLHGGGVESPNALVVDLAERRLVLVAQSEVDGHPRPPPPVVLHEEAPRL